MAGEIFVIPKTIAGERTYGNQTVLTYDIDYPQFATYVSQSFVRELNGHYRQQASKLARDIQARYYLVAIGDYIARSRQDIPFFPYEFDRPFEVTYAQDCIISLYMDAYLFTGGANGETTRASDSWNISAGQRITLSELFPQDIEYQTVLKDLIDKEIAVEREENPAAYFEDYEALVEQYFCEENFYMTPKSLVLYFQEGQIAPHATGIPTFSIPYGMLFILLPTC